MRNRLSQSFLTVWILSAAMSPAASAQTAASLSAPPAQKITTPVFDVASIKPNLSGSHSSHFGSDGNGYLKTTNTTLYQLLQGAYGLPDKRVLGGPDWINTARWDVVAKPDIELADRLDKMQGDEDRLARQQMLQALLADRFGLTVHKETRELPIYAMVVAKNGPILTKWAGEDSGVHSNNGHVTIKSKVAMSALAKFLEGRLDRVIVDKTGIEGGYELTLTWTQESMEAPKMDGISRTSSDEADGPSLFTALQEQLGLTLKSQKGQVEVLVVDKAAQPSEN